MSKTILNVVRHQGRKLRFGVINREFDMEPKPSRIRIEGLTGLNEDIIVNPKQAYYKHGSIYSTAIHNWLSQNYSRDNGDNIWLLKFTFEKTDSEHIYKYIGDTGYKKIPRKRIFITPEGKEKPCPKNAELSDYLWNITR